VDGSLGLRIAQPESLRKERFMETAMHAFEPPSFSYGFHEGHWADDEFTEAMDLVLGEEFLYGKTDLVKVTSAGIHIGSATTHLTISKLGLRKGGKSISSKSVVKTKEVFHESPIIRTPFQGDGLLDVGRLRLFLEECYDAARLIPDLIETGVVVMSGKASDGKNRLAVERLLGPQKSRFLFISEGSRLQAVLAALGAGAVAKSGGESKRVLNVDLGADGARLAWIANGSFESACSISGGARVIGYDEKGNLNHVAEVGQIIASELGLDLRLGKPVTRSERQTVGKFLADTLLDYLEEEGLSDIAKKLLPTTLPRMRAVDLVQFSGGVAEYVYGYESESHGDVGYEWGAAIRKRAPRLGVKMSVHTPRVRTRAIPIGVAHHSVHLPPESVYCSHGHLHGLKNFIVVSPRFRPGSRELDQAKQKVEEALSSFELMDGSQPFALSMDCVEGEESHEAVARGLFSALQDRVNHDRPLVLVGESGAARSIGRKVASLGLVGGDVVALCGLHTHDLDFLDVGEAERDGEVPIVTRSLVFR
jgi:ethanolamine utilization protein EutA